MNGSCAENLSVEILQQYSIAIPSAEEQICIVTHLDTKCAQIDRLIAIKQQKIDRLTQYRKSLIYEYVTGKKEVPAV